MSDKPNELPIDMRNTVISADDEKVMREMTAKPKRVRKFKEDYVQELALLRMDCHAIEVERNNLEYRIRKPSIRFALGLLFKAIKNGRL